MRLNADRSTCLTAHEQWSTVGRYQVSGIRYQVSGIRYQVSGIRYQASGIRPSDVSAIAGSRKRLVSAKNASSYAIGSLPTSADRPGINSEEIDALGNYGDIRLAV